MNIKRIILCAFFAAFYLLGIAQKVKPVEYGGTINLLEVVDQKNSVFKVRVVGYGKKEAQAQEDAEVRVIRMALYTGIDGKCRPLLREETEALNAFFENKQYKDYISEVIPAGGLMKVKGMKENKMPFDVVVRIGALDSFLRRSGYKKFGL